MKEITSKYKFWLTVVALIFIFVASYFWFSTQGGQPADQVPVSETQVQPSEESTQKQNISYTLAEIQKHGSRTDCWMAIEGKVYDVTSFIDKHPGGERVLEGCGKDATSLFRAIPKHASGIVKMLMNKYEIGELK